MGWKWNLWPVLTWLEVQRSKAVFYLILYYSINDMKHFRIITIEPQLCHSHFCCWLLPTLPMVDIWADNRAYGLCWLGWRYNGSKMSFSSYYTIVAMIWNTSELFPSHLSHATAMFVVDCCQFGPSWIFCWKWSLWPVPTWLAVQRSKAVFFLTLYGNINDMKHFWTVSITPQPCHSHVCCWLLQILP